MVYTFLLQLIKELIHHGYQSLRKVISEVPEDSSRDAVCLQQDVQLALAKYCDKYLRLAEESEYYSRVKFLNFAPSLT